MIGSYTLQVLNNGILAKNQFCTKSHVGVRVGVSFFQRFEVDNSSLFLSAGRFASAVLVLQISRLPARVNFPRAAMFIFPKLDEIL